MSEGEVGRSLELDALLAEAGVAPLGAIAGTQFGRYISLFVRWNAKMNLTSIRDVEGILSRHFVESIACAQSLPGEIATLLDFGSGGGLPGIPIALCRPEIAVTLAESQGKKAAFLQEAVRLLGISTRVHEFTCLLINYQLGFRQNLRNIGTKASRFSHQWIAGLWFNSKLALSRWFSQ